MSVFNVKERWTPSILIGALILIFVGIIDSVPLSLQQSFSSHEASFTDFSRGGLKILPASCASSPIYYHGYLLMTSDTYGYVSDSNGKEDGVTKFSTPVCVTNETGHNYFVPTKSLEELTSFKNLKTSVPNLQVY